MKNHLRSLPSPELPQESTAGNISMNDVRVAGGIFIRIPAYSDAETGDFINVFWDAESVKEVLVEDVGESFPVTVIVENNVEQGSHQVQYEVTDSAGNKSLSGAVMVNIVEGDPSVIFPAPVFIDAVGGVIDTTNITKNNGTDIKVISDENIHTGDSLNLFWRGVNASGAIVVGNILSQVVSEAGYVSGTVFHIDKAILLTLDKGTVFAHYQVLRGGRILGLSENTSVLVNLDAPTPSIDTELFVSTGAANTDINAIHVRPFNQGIAKAAPGTTLQLSVTGLARFEESQSDIYELIIDESGFSSFRLFSPNQEVVQVNAYPVLDPAKSVSQSVIFGPYRKGEGKIMYVNNSTDAPANNLTPCSIYLKTTTEGITRVKVAVTGNASINGYGSKTADIILNDDCSAEIDIINSVAERVEVEVSLPESSGSDMKFYILFVE